MIRRLTGFCLALASLGNVCAQPVSPTCFSYAFNATSAETIELLRSAIKGFESAGCATSLQAKLNGLTSGSAATAEAAVFLLYRQSQKRLAAMAEVDAAVTRVITMSGPNKSSGGLSAGYVIEQGTGGNLILKPVNPAAKLDIEKFDLKAPALKR